MTESDAFECLSHHGGIRHVTLHELGRGRQPRRRAMWMDAGLEAVQYPHRVPTFHQQVHRVRANEARSAGDKTEIHYAL